MRVIFTNDPSVNGLLQSGISVKIAERIMVVSDPRELKSLECGDVIIFTDEHDGHTIVRCVGTVTGKSAESAVERGCVDFSNGY